MYGLEEVTNSDASFWLYQGPPNNRLQACVIYYDFDEAIDEVILLSRLKEFVSSYQMLQRNVVEVNGLPHWQHVTPDWNRNFRILKEEEDIEDVRKQSEVEISIAYPPGDGLPLFRAFLTPLRRKFIFMWHHVLSDFEGIFNKMSKHIFMVEHERTRYGYQIHEVPSTVQEKQPSGLSLATRVQNLMIGFTSRPVGFINTAFNVHKSVLPIDTQTINTLGMKMGLPMSDILAFIALRSITRYHEKKGDMDTYIKPLVSPLSLRKSSLEMDEGNNRVTKAFPVVFPLESIDEMHRRIIGLAPSTGSYDIIGKVLKISRPWAMIEGFARRVAMPDYISNYFPLSDMPLKIAQATVINHDLRVPMVPFERTKFAWSSYNGDSQLYLQTDPLVVDEGLMTRVFDETVTEVITFLSNANNKE